MALVVSLPAIVLRRSLLSKADAATLVSALPASAITSDADLFAVSATAEAQLREIFSAFQEGALEREVVCWLATQRDEPGWLLVQPGEGKQVTIRLRGYCPLPPELLAVPVMPV